jgi:alpha-N-arabinofuranosidase
LPQALDVKFAGAILQNTGKLISLSALNTQATNSIDQPTNIVPVESILGNVGNELRHSMPAYSIQVIQLDVR